MRYKSQINAQMLGIDLASQEESQLFRWFLACLLFGKPVQQRIAREAYVVLTDAGITSINKLLGTSWDELVVLLDQAHYVRYDFSTATKLIDIAHTVKERYGTIGRMLKQSKSSHELEQNLMNFRGIGPVTAAIFVRDITPIWYSNAESVDFDAAKAAAMLLEHHGFEVYVIGGAVRDLWLNRQPKDFDLVTDATPSQIMAIKSFARSKYKDTAQAYGVTRVNFKHNGANHELEIATFRKDIGAHRGRTSTRVSFADLEQDVLRRDCTINALALNLSTNQVIDFVGGIDDLETKQIRFIGVPARRIREDPLRVMRAIRFKNHLQFDYHPQTVVAINAAVKHGVIESIATDRLRNELTRLLIHSTRKQALLDLDAFGILERVLPEITAGKGVDQPKQYHAEGDVWQHQLLTLDNLPAHPSEQLVWAALLHDIGKRPTARPARTPHDHIRFNRHYAVGAEMAKTVLKRLNFSNHSVKNISWMIYNHLAIDDLPQMRPSHQQRMLGHPAFEDLLELHRADAAASWRVHRPHGKIPAFRDIERLWHEYQRKTPVARQPSLKRDLGIDGTWLLNNFSSELGDNPGSLIGIILHELDERYRDTGDKNIANYQQLVRNIIASHRKTI